MQRPEAKMTLLYLKNSRKASLAGAEEHGVKEDVSIKSELWMGAGALLKSGSKAGHINRLWQLLQ